MASGEMAGAGAGDGMGGSGICQSTLKQLFIDEKGDFMGLAWKMTHLSMITL